MKIISLIVRRPDLDRAAFADHYDHRHAPLALGLLPRDCLTAYRRNHVVEPADASFDCVSEFVFADSDATRRIFEYLASPASRPVHEDEERFMDRARNAFYVVEEQVVRPRPPGPEASVAVWALTRGQPLPSSSATACSHNRVLGPSRPDAPPWAWLSELWYPDEAAFEHDRAGWPRAADGATEVVRVREQVSIPRSDRAGPAGSPGTPSARRVPRPARPRARS